MTIMDSRAYRVFYDAVRRNKALNHLAHRVMQSETTRRFGPYAALYRQVIRVKSKKYLETPDIIEFEVTNQCNSRCVMCPPQVHTGKDFLDHALFLDLAGQAFRMGIRRMILTGGEPLLDKRIYEKIAFAKRLGYTYVHMFTNGSLLNEVARGKLFGCGLDSLTLSVDSAVREEYERIRVGLRFHTVVENMRRLHAEKRAAGLEKPLIRVNMVALPENRSSRRVFLETFRDAADIVEIMDGHNFAESTEIAHDPLAWEYSQVSRDPCHLMFIKACVTPHGHLKKCSIDYSRRALMGDLSKRSLKEVLLSKRFVELKKRHLAEDFSEPGCAHCTHRESWWVDN